MAQNNTITVVGNLVRDPELRETYTGKTMCRMTVAHNRWVPEGKERDSNEAYFFDVVVFGNMAENVANSLHKGHRVVVHGTLQQKSLESDTGQRYSKVQILAEDIAPSLRHATAHVTRTQSRGRGEGRGSREYYDEPS